MARKRQKRPKMTKDGKIWCHQPLLPIKTSNNDIRYKTVNSTSLEGCFNLTTHFRHKNFFSCCCCFEMGLKMSKHDQNHRSRVTQKPQKLCHQQLLLIEIFNNHDIRYKHVNSIFLEGFF